MGIDVSKFENWLKDGIGRVSESPIGNMVESAVGSVYDRIQKYRDPAGINDVIKRNEFEVSLLILAAAVIKADKVTSEFELQYVREFLLKNFDNQFIESRMFLLEKILEKKFDLEEVCKQINQIKPPGVRRQLVVFLFHVADADLVIADTEVNTIQKIAGYLGLSENDYQTVKAMFLAGTQPTSKSAPAAIEESNHAILGVSANASPEKIKDAYRSLIKKFHPDVVAHLGAKVQESARQNFLKIKAAYEAITEK